VTTADFDDRIVKWLREHPMASAGEVADATGISNKVVALVMLRRLSDEGRVRRIRYHRGPFLWITVDPDAEPPLTAVPREP